MYQFLKLTLLGGWRVRSSRTILALTLLAIASAWLAGTFSLRQPQTVAFDVGFSLIRILAALMAIFWVQELISKDLERKTVLWACANPVSRSQYVLGRFLGIAGMSFLMLVLMGAALFLIQSWVAPQVYQAIPVQSGWILVLLFACLWLDILVITAFSILMALVSTTALLPFFLSIVFMIVARGLGPTLAYVRSGDSRSGAWEPLLDFLQWILPDLSRYDIRGMALYGQIMNENSTWALAMQAGGYVAIILLIATFAFSRREFE